VVCAATDADRVRTKRNARIYFIVFIPFKQYYPDAELFVKIFLREYAIDNLSWVKLKMDAADRVI